IRKCPRNAPQTLAAQGREPHRKPASDAATRLRPEIPEAEINARQPRPRPGAPPSSGDRRSRFDQGMSNRQIAKAVGASHQTVARDPGLVLINRDCSAIGGLPQYAHGVSNLVLSFSFLTGESLLGKLSETVVLQGNAPHDRPCSLVSHLIDNRASFLCTKAPMLRVISVWHQISGCSCVTCVDCEWPVVLLVET